MSSSCKAALAFALCLTLLTHGIARAQSTQPVYTLHGFSGPDGSGPDALTYGKDGTLYGTTQRGGTNTSGTVYKIAPDGTFTLLYSFSALSPVYNGSSFVDNVNSDGAQPDGVALDGAGDLWGIAQYGGTNGVGTVFEITPDGTFHLTHTFSALQSKYVTYSSLYAGAISVNADGGYPTGLTTGRDGSVYGAALTGGTGGAGTLFKVGPGVFQTLHSFSQTHLTSSANAPPDIQDFRNDDGAQVQNAPLVSGPDGSLYGMTSEAGPGGFGTVFRLSLSGAFSVLSVPGNGVTHTAITGNVNGVVVISSIFEARATSLSLGSDGNLYGAFGDHVTQDTSFSPNGSTVWAGGTLFRLSTGGTFTTLFQFPNYVTSPYTTPPPPPQIGTDPTGLVQAPDGSFYGAAGKGGTSNSGTVFHLIPDTASPTGFSVKTLYAVVQDGADPMNLLLAPDGNLYGTGGGGVKGSGVVFEIAPTPPPFVLHAFAGTDGFDPISLLFGGDGNLYGSTYSSTANGKGIGDGTFFTLTPDSTPTHDTLRTLYDQFHYTRNNTGIILGSNGLFYGTTEQQGPGPMGYGAGGIYSLSAGGLLSDLYDFPGGGNPAIGGTPFGGVIFGPGGLLYGTTNTTTYAFNPISKVLTPLHTFVYQDNGPTLPDDGTSPQGNLLLASDGLLYGVTGRGGQDPNSGEGVIYSLDPNGTAPDYGFRLLHRFNPTTEGGSSPGALVEGKDGALYGTLGAIYYQPAVFKINKDGTGFQILYHFTYALPPRTPSPPTTPLVLASDGLFYAMIGNGNSGGGEIFRINSDGSNFGIAYQFNGPDGEDHYNGDFVAPLVPGPNGDLYGVAGSGGLYGYMFNEPYVDGFGTVFHLAITRPGASPATAAALDVTGQAQFQFLGQSYVGGHRLYAYRLTATGASLAGPLSVAMDGLPSGLQVLNAAGYTVHALPAGSPFVPLIGSLPLGNSLVVKFVTNQALPQTLALRLLSGPGAR